MDSKIYNLKFVSDFPILFDENVIYVEKIVDDTIGTTFGAAWVYVFDKNHNKKIALFKPLDYDEPLGAYAELLYSNLANLVFKNIEIRIPEIKLVLWNNNLGILSYSVVDSKVEDLIHMESIMYHKYERSDLKHFFTLGIEDILECVNLEICNFQNFSLAKQAIIYSLLLDSLTNNVDRHGKNWGLVRNKITSYYELALFDNTKSFINMFFNRVGYSNNDLWAITYNSTKSSPMIGSGKDICFFIKDSYPAEFNDFVFRIDATFNAFANSIYPIPGIDSRRITTFLKRKIRLFTNTEV